MIETKSLRLRKAVFEDWQDMYERVWSREETARFMLWNVTRSEADAKNRMERTIAYQKDNPLGYIVCEKESDRPIGFAGLKEIEERFFEDTGVALGPAFVGKGYGKEILEALAGIVFNELDGKRFICSCRSDNEPSRRLQLSCGFTFSHSEDRVDPRTGDPYVLEFYELMK